MDACDRAILDVLQREGRIPNVQLASRVHLSESACLRRVRALEKAGLINATPPWSTSSGPASSNSSAARTEG